MAEWVGDERAQTLTIGHVRADVWMYGGCTVRSTVEPRGCKNLDAAKAAAEQALREMHDALATHFAPVLRWQDTDDARPDSTASVCGWELHAAHGNWALQHESGATLYSPRPNQSSREANRRAAEAALRSLGVTFRTEGE